MRLIQENIKKLNPNNSKLPKIICVSKTFTINKLEPLIKYGHNHFGENKVQEANAKWSELKKTNTNLKLHMVGRLQTNKAKKAVSLFDFIHSLDSQNLADKLKKSEEELNKKLQYFVQVNIGDEKQKSGITKLSLPSLYSYCKSLNLDVIGLMCIPPLDESSINYFKEMNILNKNLGLNELSMGMSADYIDAIKNSATYLRIGSSIFGKRI